MSKEHLYAHLFSHFCFYFFFLAVFVGISMELSKHFLDDKVSDTAEFWLWVAFGLLLLCWVVLWGLRRKQNMLFGTFWLSLIMLGVATGMTTDKRLKEREVVEAVVWVSAVVSGALGGLLGWIGRKR